MAESKPIADPPDNGGEPQFQPPEPCRCPHCTSQGKADQRSDCRWYRRQEPTEPF